MKRLMILFAMAMMCSIVMAQTETTRTIHGAVIDKNGNPLPGAVVSATEGAETTLVNPDGTFDLEIPIWLRSVTASYAGYKNKKMKPRFDRDMVFRLSKDNKRYGFLNVFGGVSFYDGYKSPSMGLMGGMLGNIGFYLKFGVSIDPRERYVENNFSTMINDDLGIGYLGIVGMTKRLYKNFYAYLGAGYGSVMGCRYYYETDRGWYMKCDDPYDGMAFDGGFFLGIGRHFNISIGFTHTNDFRGNYDCIPNLSLGYIF